MGGGYPPYPPPQYPPLQWQKFLFLNGGHVGAQVGVQQHGVSIQSYLNLSETLFRITHEWITSQILVLARFFYISIIFPQLLEFIHWTVTIFILDDLTLQTSHSVQCKRVKSAHAKLGVRAKKDGVGGSFVSFFCSVSFRQCKNTCYASYLTIKHRASFQANENNLHQNRGRQSREKSSFF